MDDEITSEILIGLSLREAREAKNLTTEEVSKQLRLSEKQINALESDDFDGFASAMLTRGFIKNYARLLGLDPEPLLEAHRKIAPIDQVQSISYISETVVPLPQASKSKLFAFFLIGVFGLGVLVWAVYHFITKPEVPNQAEIALDQFASQTPEQTADVKAPKTLLTSNAELKAPKDAVLIADPLKPSVVSPIAIVGGIKVTFKFTEESWVSVLDKNDKSVLSKLGRAGDVDEVEGLPPLKVVIGNANGTQVFLKNKNIDLSPYNKSNVVHITFPTE